MNSLITFFLFFSTLYSQVNITNELEVRYGDSANDYNYNEVYLDTKLSLNREDYRLESIFTFETPSSTEWRTYNNNFVPNFYVNISNNTLFNIVQGINFISNQLSDIIIFRLPQNLKEK